jgi:hypothetical protein
MDPLVDVDGNGRRFIELNSDDEDVTELLSIYDEV